MFTRMINNFPRVLTYAFILDMENNKMYTIKFLLDDQLIKRDSICCGLGTIFYYVILGDDVLVLNMFVLSLSFDLCLGLWCVLSHN